MVRRVFDSRSWRSRAVAYALIVLAVLALSYEQISVPLPPPSEGGIATLLARYGVEWPEETQISIVVVTDSSASFCGFIHHGGVWQAIDNRDSVFEIGSVTKLFTSSLLAQMVASGTVQLDDQVSTFFPSSTQLLSEKGQKITLGQLANHTSGLPSVPSGFLLQAGVRGQSRSPYEWFDSSRLAEYMKSDLVPESDPGVKYGYSNLGMGILGQILAKQVGRSYEELLQDSILIPLAMASTSTSAARVLGRMVDGIDQDGTPAPNWDMGALAGAGALKSCASDLAKFIVARMKHSEVAQEMCYRPTFRIAPDIEIGLGWNIYHLGRDTVWYGHDGGTRGYETALRIDFGHNRGMAVLSNVSELRPTSVNIQYLCMALMRRSDL